MSGQQHGAVATGGSRVGVLRDSMKSTKKAKKEKPIVCTVCGAPATTAVDGEPSCEKHRALIYENQVEDYTKDEQANNAWVKP